MDERRIILLVEDDPTQRLGVADLVEEAGFRVIEAFSHDDALRKLDLNGGVSVMITDVAMPGVKSGIDVVGTASELWPATLVIVLSGQRPPAKATLSPSIKFLQKPCKDSELLALVTNS